MNARSAIAAPFGSAGPDLGQPRTLAGYRDLHRGETIVVCGCGPSLNELPEPQRFVTIGVNDVGRLFGPTYLVVVNPRQQFKGDRFRYVEQSKARALFTQLDLGRVCPPIVRFKLGQYGGTDIHAGDVLHYTQNSPYVAVCLAAFMGAKRIGLIGVDLTEGHFFGPTGRHALAGRLKEIDAQYGRLAAGLKQRGVELANLSPGSLLTSLPRADWSWLALPRPEACAQRAGGLRIVSYATTPVAGVPAILARCIASATGHSARCVWATEAYGNGVEFAGDVQWRRQPREAAELLEAADLVIVHNGKVDAAHRRLLESKPVVTMAHNYGWNVDWHFVRRGLPGVVVAQYQATLPEFAGWTLVPNPIPLWEPEHLPGDKGHRICIAFTPSGRHDCYPEGHRLYWHSKGYDTTMRVLERLGRQRQVRVETTARGQVSHAKALAMKRSAHIVIDECVTGSYHRNSLEGLAVGSVVVNGFGLIPGVREAFVRCAGDCPDWLFTPATLATLEARLDELVSQGPQELLAQGRRRRSWMEAHWDFRTQWDQHWRPVIEQAINNGHRHRGDGNTQPPPARQPDMRGAADATVAEGGMSVVVPFSGSQRLGLLAATLAGLRQSAAVDQIIVAEVGSHPLALDVVQRWDADYVFITSLGSFDKARAVNTGSTLARQSEILWCDGDLLFGDDFLSRAQRELRGRGLDFLFPFSRIEYLDDVQSRGVCAGTRSPVDCRVVRVLRPMHGGAIGGVGLVRAQFLRRYGGMIEGFLGWGGEDNAWVHKASLLGRVGVTEQADQVAWHLYHPDSGATGGQPWRSNPKYARNVELLSRVQRIRTADELVREFPQPAYEIPPWPARTRLGFVAVTRTRDAPGRAVAASWADRLSQAYGITVQVLQTDPGGLAAAVEALCAEAIVGFVEDAATCAALAARLQGRQAVVVLGEKDPDAEGPPISADGLWIVARTREQAVRWRRQGLRVWHRAWHDPAPPEASAIPVVIQPLSLLLSAREPARAALLRSATHAGPEVPVWCYWEGPMPDWIASCLETVRLNAPTLRLLAPSDFDALWDRDRDIDLSKLHVAQRADFVRAFLLMRFGGLWVDADCIVMRDLSPLLAQLGEFDVIAHRERQGFFSNAFLAAKPGSAVAARFYQTLCSRLRSRRPLNWIALGNEPLTELLRSVPERLLELPTEQVQPVCWSQPEVYFRQADDAEHERELDTQAWCYMLSQQNIIRYQNGTPSAALTADRSFFSFLLRRARADVGGPHADMLPQSSLVDEAREHIGPPATTPLMATFERMCAEHLAQGHDSVSGPGSSMQQTAELRRRLPLLLQHLDARVLLDAPCGDFHWMAQVRLGVDGYIGVDLLEGLIRRNRERHSAPGRRFLALNLMEDPLPKADVVLCRDCLGHLAYEDIVRILSNFIASGSRYLLTTTFPSRRQNADIRTGQWRPLNLQAAPFSLPTPLHLINEKCSESSGAFKDKSLGLWRLADLSLDRLRRRGGANLSSEPLEEQVVGT